MTVTDPAASAPAKLGFGPVIQGTFGVLKRNIQTFLVLTALLQGVPLLLMFGGAASLGSPSGAGFGLISLGGLVLAVASAILAPALVHGTVADLNGRKPSLSECLSGGLRHAVPVFAVMFVAAIGIFFGFLLLFVPGVMLLIAWSVAGPAKVVERVGVLGALGRSGALTKGSRWRLFWLFVLYSIVSGAVQQSLLGVALMLPGTTPGATGPAAVLTPAYGVVALILTVANTLVSYVGLAVIYYELRRLKEGIGPEALAAIFD
jgi:hypothetical protein